MMLVGVWTSRDSAVCVDSSIIRKSMQKVENDLYHPLHHDATISLYSSIARSVEWLRWFLLNIIFSVSFVFLMQRVDLWKIK